MMRFCATSSGKKTKKFAGKKIAIAGKKGKYTPKTNDLPTLHTI